jgi:hypothetical protein
MRRLLSSILLSSILVLTPHTASSINPRATLDQLKTLEILCYVPTWLPKDFKLRSVIITYDKPGPDEGSVGRFPLYWIEYGNGPTSPPHDSGQWSDRTGGATFTIESARQGIGDRNIMETEDSDEITIPSPFGPMHLIYTPKGKGASVQKVEIKANWVADPNMKFENTALRGSGRIDDIKGHPQGEIRGQTKLVKAKDPRAHPVLGRYHGFSATAIRLADFEKIIRSLKPIRP